MSQHDTLTPEQLDQHLDAILKAAGSALRYYTMQKSRDDMRAALSAALSATQPAQAAQGAGEGEVVALPIFDDLDDEAIDVACTAGSIYRVDFMRAYTALRDWCPHYTVPEQPAAGADAPPAQPAPVVPEGWKLVPIKCTEAMKDVGGQFEFATIADGRLLAQSMWNELLLATPTPPAQAAADARDAQPMIPLSMLRPIAVEAIRSITGCPDLSSGDRHLTDEIEAVAIAALATHQQGGK